MGTSAYAVTATGRTVFTVDLNGFVHGFEPRNGASKWTPAKRFFIGGETPVAVVGEVAYGADEDRNFLAVDTVSGAVRWELQYPNPGVVITLVAGTAGSLVFSVGEVFDQSGGTGRGVLWCLDTASHTVKWTLDDVSASLAVVASEPAGVVVAADQTTYQLTGYSVQDGRVLWRKGVQDSAGKRPLILPTACVAVSGDTFYWAGDKVYALDAVTGDVRWAADVSDPKDKFQSVIVLPGPDLVVATSIGPNGGKLHAFARETGVAKWTVRGGPQFGVKTDLAAGSGGSAGVLYAAEPDNGSVFAVDAATGQTRWTYHEAEISADRRWTITADEQRVYVAYAESVLAFEP